MQVHSRQQHQQQKDKFNELHVLYTYSKSLDTYCIKGTV